MIEKLTYVLIGMIFIVCTAALLHSSNTELKYAESWLKLSEESEEFPIIRMGDMVISNDCRSAASIKTSMAWITLTISISMFLMGIMKKVKK